METRAARVIQYSGRKRGTALLVAFHVLGKPGGEIVPTKRVRIEDCDPSGLFALNSSQE